MRTESDNPAWRYMRGHEPMLTGYIQGLPNKGNCVVEIDGVSYLVGEKQVMKLLIHLEAHHREKIYTEFNKDAGENRELVEECKQEEIETDRALRKDLRRHQNG